jgi:hypothetical protein
MMNAMFSWMNETNLVIVSLLKSAGLRDKNIKKVEMVY